MTVLITDPTSAYTNPVTEGAPGAIVAEYRTVTALTKGQAVKLTVSGTGADTLFTVAAAADDDDNVIGVVQKSVTGTSALPKPIPVVIEGPALAQTADADIEVGDWVSASTAGVYAKAVTAAIADADTKVFAYTLEATAASTDSAGDLKWVYVTKALVAVT